MESDTSENKKFRDQLLKDEEDARKRAAARKLQLEQKIAARSKKRITLEDLNNAAGEDKNVPLTDLVK